MPVADKSHTITEESQLCDANEQIILPPQLSSNFSQLEEVLGHIAKIKRLHQDEQAEHKRIEKLVRANEEAKEVIARSEAKLESQRKRAQALKLAVDNKKERIRKSESYWDDYGLEVKQLSPEQYQFIYSKLTPANVAPHYVDLEIKEKRVSCTSVTPPILNQEQIQDLNAQLAQDINYRKAMLIIRAELIKRLNS